ncbi:GNAT family N-acetyltransferase [Dokdonella soli]
MSDDRSRTRPPRRERRARTAPRSRAGGEAFTTADGRTLFLRPIRPDDVEALRRGFARLTPEQVRQRVFHRMTELTPDVAELLANVDPDKGAAYVATDAEGEIRGEARLYVDTNVEGAEFALVVDPELTGQGVGRTLVRRLIDESRRRGLSELWGFVLAGNGLMLDFASRLGAKREAVPEEPDLVRVHFDLRDPRIGADD